MNKQDIEIIGDNHISSSVETPMLSNAFNTSDDEKIKTIQHHFGKIMETLGLDLSDDSLSGTPYRFAKMYVKELYYGLNPKNKPKMSVFDNKYGYKKMLVEQNITIDSSCEHHFLPIIGHAHIAYIPKEKVIGLSKINRLVDYYAHRPQVQERLSLQILKDLQNILETKDVIVMICAKHLCVSSRGIKDKDSFTTTIEYDGSFEEKIYREEFLNIINNQKI
ncbi:GTP cyclohydrolase I [Polaribacter sp. Hel1_33_78]|jgi:GTP cyclohydrolase I|uniref:GTP cyclohydrolase I FolE n=1 Tax=unclassified Polaribacter TaxID=196858 RepID=UPI00052C29D5|nr:MULTISPECIES: GTP cyclohydrolase I FolE [unclassified Polaribacter]MBT3742682.1 GTP cyclohydrolase I FolE [Polaribacter sp.]KGL59890.1 GTP cyclohydrolase I [Polaribacter sp. Hel1_33_49]MBT4412653.1 GTP cyclohydrolase I FolE [Polaribacter sp.]MDG2435578.1 GTP cyclohydrolase I FolE [Polaribacter sp.]PKV65797.1 GTP cyclohydrolase I [Polaribacter sp. Hel1_33_96]